MAAQMSREEIKETAGAAKKMPASNKVCKSNNVHASSELIADVSLQKKKEKKLRQERHY